MHYDSRMNAPTSAPQAAPENDALAATYRARLREAPDAIETWYRLANIDGMMFDADETATLERLHANTADANARTVVGFVLAHALEDQGRYAEAFTTLSGANAAHRRRVQWDGDAFRRSIDATIDAAAAKAPTSVSQQGGDAIFLIGLPSAGADAVEKILAGHPDVEAGHVPSDLGPVIEAAMRARTADFAGFFAGASDADWQSLGERYVERTSMWRGARPRFVDAALSNWRFAGAIAAMLPGARVIDCRDGALATCVGNWRTLFEHGQAFTYDTDELADCWRAYDALMNAWNARQPGRIHVVERAQLAADPDGTIAELLEYCGLSFDDACVARYRALPPSTIDARVAGYGDLLMALKLALGTT
jgi:hypothetical protein